MGRPLPRRIVRRVPVRPVPLVPCPQRQDSRRTRKQHRRSGRGLGRRWRRLVAQLGEEPGRCCAVCDSLRLMHSTSGAARRVLTRPPIYCVERGVYFAPMRLANSGNSTWSPVFCMRWMKLQDPSNHRQPLCELDISEHSSASKTTSPPFCADGPAYGVWLTCLNASFIDVKVRPVNPPEPSKYWPSPCFGWALETLKSNSL